MKSSLKYICILSASVLCWSACTFGDKGSEKVPDSVRIDTSRKSDVSTTANGANGTATGNAGKSTTQNDSTRSDSLSKNDPTTKQDQSMLNKH